jgi:hypothetical protein
VRVCEEDGKTTNLSGNPVCLVFCPLTIGAKTLSLSITNEEYTVVSFPHIVTFSCPFANSVGSWICSHLYHVGKLQRVSNRGRGMKERVDKSMTSPDTPRV